MTFGQASLFVDQMKVYMGTETFKHNADEEALDTSLDVSMQSTENEDEGKVINMSRLAKWFWLLSDFPCYYRVETDGRGGISTE